MLGGRVQDDKESKSVLTYSLAVLLQSCQPQSLGLKNLSLTSGPEVWHQLDDTPVTFSTCASLHGQVLAVGGETSVDEEATAVHMYKTTTNSWEVISHMATPRRQCLAAVLPHSKLMVVGGFTAGDKTDFVEIASII